MTEFFELKRMIDLFELKRREMLANVQQDCANATQHWTTEEIRREFEVLGFAAPLVAVRRKTDGVEGTFEFTHSPRLYFNWVEDIP